MSQSKISVGILGATGMVGQNYLKLLQNHPWFEINFLAASEKSAGRTYSQAVSNKWILDQEIPTHLENLNVYNVQDIDTAKASCNLVFSCFEGGSSEEIRQIELDYAKAGLWVVSNSSAHRWTPEVPILIPEINSNHLEIIQSQRNLHGFNKGGIVVKPNCSLQTFILPVFALNQAGFEVDKLVITTLQASSGAGYPGVPSLDLIDNMVPFIGGEEAKTENEPLKIFGNINNGKIENFKDLNISATCTRVPVISGHTATVSLGFKDKKPTKEQILEIWKSFTVAEMIQSLPSSPKQIIVYKNEENRPQPRRDRYINNGMSAVVGRLRECSILDYKFVCMSDNLIRGASGGGVLNAELLVAKGLV